MRNQIRIFLAFLSLALALVFHVPYGFAIDDLVEDTVLKGNWQEVVELLKKREANDPVERLLMGHASLATNRNNAAQLLFLSVKSEKDLKRWSAWTDALLRKHPRNPISLYLSADAKARTGRFTEAIKTLTQVIQLKPDFALALNARGVIRVLTLTLHKFSLLGDFRRLSRPPGNATARRGRLGLRRG